MGDQTCIQFTRSSPSFQSVDCVNQTYREQLNLVTSYLDLYQVYGSSASIANSLRTFTNGQMITSAGLSPNRPYLPKSAIDQCSTNNDLNLKCFQAGESRTSENLGLAGIQTLFLREHNRLALALANLNPSWNDNTLFFEARKILIGIYQHIIYTHWIKGTISCGNDKELNDPASANKNYSSPYNATVGIFYLPRRSKSFIESPFRLNRCL